MAAQAGRASLDEEAERTSDAAEGSRADARRVTFELEHQPELESRQQCATSSTAPPPSTSEDHAESEEQILGYGSARLNADQLDDWSRTDLSQASAHRSTEAQAAQEAAWVAGFNQDGRSNWSIREAVRLHAQRFVGSVRDFDTARLLARAAISQSPLAQLPTSSMALVADAALGIGPVVNWVAAWPRHVPHGGAVRVAVRKRPLLPFEHERAEWDCVEADARRSSLLCHDGRLARNGKRLSMVHRRYMLDQVWDESTGNEQVSADAVLPLLRWARRSKSATLLCYGQTGTGKTHTLGGCLDLLTEELEKSGEEAEAQFFEVRGKRLLDLLAGGEEVQLRADAEGLFHLRGAARIALRGAEATRQLLAEALALRASEETERNPLSSRSHAILVVWLQDGGMLRFVDLAGSERNYETEKMTAAQHRESAEINSSLMALKDCFRAHAALHRGEKARPPYRASRLTQCLRDCFEDAEHRFTLIATVSPSSSDVIHTANTLNHAVMMVGALEAAKTDLQVNMPLGVGQVAAGGVPIDEWGSAEVAEWAATVERGRFAQLVLPPDLDGRGLLALSAQGLAKMFERDLRQARAQGEGTSWNVSGYEEGQGSGVVLGKALFAAVRREALAGVSRSKAAGTASLGGGSTAAVGLAGA